MTNEDMTLDSEPTGFVLKGKTYEFAKWFALIVFPAFIVFYGVLGMTIPIENTDKVLTIMVGFNAFLGAVLGVSSKTYNASDARFDGQMDVVTNGRGTMRNVIDLGDNLETLPEHRELRLKVNTILDPNLKSNHPDIDDDVPTA